MKTTQNMSESVKDEQLSLKVMRLARPKLNDVPTIPIDPCNEISKLIGNSFEKMIGHENIELPVGTFLMVPQTFDSIYLGETFTFYVCVRNDCEKQCENVNVRVQLQTNSQKPCVIPKLQDISCSLKPGASLGHVLSYEVKETGQHILLCEVDYVTNESEIMHFKKYFKFSVNKPIDVKTKFYNAEDNLNNDVYLEAQIQNTCDHPIVLEKVDLNPSEFYTCSEIKISPKSTVQLENVTSFISSHRESSPIVQKKFVNDPIYLNPKDVRQYLFCLSPSMPKHTANQFRGVTTIGKLDMGWRTSMGEKGRLQTSPLIRMAPGYGDLRLIIKSIPAKIQLRRPFEVVFCLYNFCERNLDLKFDVTNTSLKGIEFCCLTGVHLGQIAPNTTVDFKLTLLPVKPGLQYLSGIRILDKFLNRIYEFDEVFNVFIQEN
uniref:Trafficking protein particle complex subunit 13 n=1 Tax=Rhabditophanes sp. KR3021 TaxID=114890 RepID=A0AC35TZF8_9BILA